MVCDSCGRTRDPLFKTRITLEGTKGVYADLCTECRKPLDKVIASITATRGRPRVSISELPMVNPEAGDGPESAGNGPRRREHD